MSQRWQLASLATLESLLSCARRNYGIYIWTNSLTVSTSYLQGCSDIVDRQKLARRGALLFSSPAQPKPPCMISESHFTRRSHGRWWSHHHTLQWLTTKCFPFFLCYVSAAGGHFEKARKVCNSWAKPGQSLLPLASKMTSKPLHPPPAYFATAKKWPNLFAKRWAVNVLFPTLENFTNSFLPSAWGRDSIVANIQITATLPRTRQTPTSLKNPQDRCSILKQLSFNVKPTRIPHLKESKWETRTPMSWKPIDKQEMSGHACTCQWGRERERDER